MSWDYAHQKRRKIIAKKFGGNEKMSTFAIPNEKRGTQTLQVWQSKFIEKTVLLYKKQVPRNTIYREALTSFEIISVRTS